MGDFVAPYGAWEQGQAASGAAHYNANIATQNAAISRKNAEIAEQSGEAQVSVQGQRTKAGIADTVAHQASSGVDTQGGSYTDVRNSERELGEMDAQTIRTNAAREAFGYRAKAQSEEDQSTLDSTSAANDVTAGNLNAASTFIGSVTGAAQSYSNFKLAGGFG